MSNDPKNPLVTVICPTYNCKATLRCALRSVLNQDFTDFEVRVIGDACTDGTEEVVAELNDPRLHWFNLPRNTGSQSEPNNEGLRRARGRYIAFIGHDDLWFPWHLSRLIRQLEQTGADLVHDLVANVAPDGVGGVYGPPHPRAGYVRIYFPTSSWLHRAELPKEIGFWRNPDDLAWAMDYDFTCRAAEAGKKLVFLPSLGALKFHSASWKLYSRKGEPPQERWLSSMLKTPERLNEEVLAQLAAQFAQHSQLNDKIPPGLAWNGTKQAVRVLGKAWLRELSGWYGNDRWPVSALLRQRLRFQTRLKAEVVGRTPSLC